MMLRRLPVATAMVALIAAATVPAAPAAAPSVFLPAEGIDWAAGTVNVSAEYPPGTISVVFTANGQLVATVPVAGPALAGTVSSGVAFRLVSPTELRAEFQGPSETPAVTAALALAPEMFRPSAPRLALARRTIVGPSFTLEAMSNHPVTDYALEAEPQSLKSSGSLVGGGDGRIVISSISVPWGVEKIRLRARNGFGVSAPSATRTIYNLGPKASRPDRSRYILVDKRSMSLYDIRGDHVLRRFDIAIGTPSTPTPGGYFKIGAARPSAGVWGVLRRPLYRFSRSGIRATGYYIHGTDTPWDIGTWASHGCVRMYNWAIRMLSRTVPSGTVVLIRG